MAAFLAERHQLAEWVWCSTARRTQETWALMAPHWPESPVLALDPSLYLAGPDDILRRVRETPERIGRVMVIGHNPGMHGLAWELAQHFVEQEIAIRTHFPTAAVAIFQFDIDSWSQVEPDQVADVIFQVPRQLVS